VAGLLTIDPVGSVDNVEVSGTIAADSIVVSAGAITTVRVGTTKTANIPLATTETISILTDEGGDTVTGGSVPHDQVVAEALRRRELAVDQEMR